MARPATKLSRVRGYAPRGGAGRLAIILFALLAFTLQTYVTQTHIHSIGRTSIAAALDENIVQKQQHDKSPTGDDPANCPICQEILHSSHYVAPPPAAVVLPTTVTFVVAITIDIVTIAQAYSHSWKSRAPPSA